MALEEKNALKLIEEYLKKQDPENTGKINGQDYTSFMDQIKKVKSVAEAYVLTEQFFFDASKIIAGGTAAPATPTDLRNQLITQVNLESKNRDNNESKALIAYNLMRGSESAQDGLDYNPDNQIFSDILNAKDHKEAEAKAVTFYNTNKAAIADQKVAEDLVKSLHIVPSAASSARRVIDDTTPDKIFAASGAIPASAVPEKPIFAASGAIPASAVPEKPIFAASGAIPASAVPEKPIFAASGAIPASAVPEKPIFAASGAIPASAVPEKPIFAASGAIPASAVPEKPIFAASGAIPASAVPEKPIVKTGGGTISTPNFKNGGLGINIGMSTPSKKPTSPKYTGDGKTIGINF